MKCPRCKAEVPDNSKFCLECGTRVRSTTQLGGTGTPPPGSITGEPTICPEFGIDFFLGGRYRIKKEIGRGGMGVVYLAHDDVLEINVALKVLSQILTGNSRAVEALKREARTAMKLRHPYIVGLHNFAEEGEVKFLVMEYVKGLSLDYVLHKREKLTLEETLRIAKRIAAALDYAHSQHVLHRDVKPGNILIGNAREGRTSQSDIRHRGTLVKITDFGIAREMQDTLTGLTGRQTSGTLLYMSPEQLMGDKLDRRADVYSLAATLYECLVGHPPFNTGDITTQIRYKPPPDIDGLPLHLNAALQNGLAKDKSKRPLTCGGLYKALSEPARRIARKKPLEPPPPKPVGPPSPPPKKRRRRIGLTLTIFAVVALLIGGGVLFAALWSQYEKTAAELLTRADGLYDKGDFAGALREYDAILALYPYSRSAALAAKAKQEIEDEAENILKEATGFIKEGALGKASGKIDVLQKYKGTKAAGKAPHLRQWINAEERAKRLLEQADGSFNEGKFKEALRKCEEIFPILSSYEETETYKNAEDLKKKTEESLAQQLLEQAKILEERGLMKDALAKYEDIIRLYPRTGAAEEIRNKKAEKLLECANDLWKRGERNKALATCGDVLDDYGDLKGKESQAKTLKEKIENTLFGLNMLNSQNPEWYIVQGDENITFDKPNCVPNLRTREVELAIFGRRLDTKNTGVNGTYVFDVTPCRPAQDRDGLASYKVQFNVTVETRDLKVRPGRDTFLQVGIELAEEKQRVGLHLVKKSPGTNTWYAVLAEEMVRLAPPTAAGALSKECSFNIEVGVADGDLDSLKVNGAETVKKFKMPKLRRGQKFRVYYYLSDWPVGDDGKLPRVTISKLCVIRRP